MKIQFLGAARTTTGSMYLLEVNSRRVLLECGLFQGRRGESILRNKEFPFDPQTLDAAILSHAHIDHCGNFPNLYRQGFRGSIYCTFGTRDLAALMLADSAHIQLSDTEFVNKLRARKGEPPVAPLYSVQDAEQVTRQFVALGYDRAVPVTDGLTVTFVDAGHILGSAQVVLDIKEKGRQFRYLFSGDVGRGGDPILRDPAVVEGVDFLQVESTYGAREHESRDQSPCAFKDVADTLRRAGKVIIPAFAVGRTQQVVYGLKRCIEEEHLPAVPMYVDSPLAVNATEVFRLHPECFNEATYEFLIQEGSPFDMTNLTYIRNVEHSKKLNDLPGPMIIISASGMAEAGRIRHHLRNNLGNANNLVLFVGYCAEHTLGAQLLAGRNPVNIFGEPVEVRARMASIDALSGHADRSELADYVRRIQGSVKRIFVVHGEEDQSLAFAETLRQSRPQAQVVVPVRGQHEEV
ncbi:MAG TPA: MBL fold metallo-hydrolase [Verrucomicrobiota bacterium]|nr:MBL fold metallo-hydrolase [Verrucomicrobiota bacterium]